MCADAPNLPAPAPAHDREGAIVAALVAARACALGAAMGGSWRRPNVGSAVHALALETERARAIAQAWDRGDHRAALGLAEAAGLGPRIEAFVAAHPAGASA